MIVVSDTSPISNLAAIGQLELLQQLYGTLARKYHPHRSNLYR